MDEKLDRLYQECIQELDFIGIHVREEAVMGKIDIKIATRSVKRYGCCRQEEPDEKSKQIERKGYRRITRYYKYNKHHIEISAWVMDLDDRIIKNTIIHELIHCIPYCNNHGKEFKKYANVIHTKLGYDIARAGNKKEDYQKSNLVYVEEEKNNYKIECKTCGQVFYRKRLAKNFTLKYRCGNCKGKFVVTEL